MPSLKNKPPPEKQKKQTQAFAGQGVRLGSVSEGVKEETKKQTTFSGLTKVNSKQVKVDFKWRCQYCLMLNKVEDGPKCSKCGQSRAMTTEEEQKAKQEEAELAKLMKEWGDVDQIEEQREDVLDLVSELEIEATPIFICYTLEKLVMVLGNIINKPEEEKFKTLKMDNNVFYSNIGRFATGVKLIKYLGFESVRLTDGKLAYQYKVPTSKVIHPLLLLTYDELRTALAKNQGSKLCFEEGKFDVSEQAQEEFDRVECAFCLRKFAKDRVDTHQLICMKIKQKPKRKAWDGAKRRLQGTVFENYKPQYKNYFHDRFEICLSRRDQANMEKIVAGLKLTREEYYQRREELKIDTNWYFRCRQCRQIMHESLTKKHRCELYSEDEGEERKESDKTVKR